MYMKYSTPSLTELAYVYLLVCLCLFVFVCFLFFLVQSTSESQAAPHAIQFRADLR